MRCLNDIIDSIYMTLSKPPEIVKDKGGLHAVVHGGRKKLDMTGQLNNNNNRDFFTLKDFSDVSTKGNL